MDIIINGILLAYIGDAYYELYIRDYLISKSVTKVDILHKKAVKYTSGVAQANIIKTLINANKLTNDEIEAFKKGRNAHVKGRKNIDLDVYHLATGFEALLGTLYYENKKRLDEVINLAIKIVEEGIINGESSCSKNE